ncbi:hypothetical protein C8R45DRAFT_1104788 [Mycena sanguinolenta]|nr:hypothetical protein C8R45DRAFT_1104788 [Mycena sanguinolenta]
MPAARTPRGHVAFVCATSEFTYIFWAHMPSSQIPFVAPFPRIDGEGSERDHSMSQALVLDPPAETNGVQNRFRDIMLRVRIPLIHDVRVAFLLEARTRAIHKRVAVDSWDSLVECAVQPNGVAKEFPGRCR